jgi:hypothetical protein
MRFIPMLFSITLAASGADRGVPPRPTPLDYPAQQTIADWTLAAAIVPVKQMERMFSSDIAKHYVVVETAVYPRDGRSGRSFEVDRFDFGLKSGDTVAHAEKPRDVATPWPERNRVPDGPVSVISDTGVIISRTSDPVNGSRTRVGTYEGVGVTNDPRARSPQPPNNQGPDPKIVEQRVAETALPEGPTNVAVAGYLFFPRDGLKRPKGPTFELQWTREGSAATLLLSLK